MLISIIPPKAPYFSVCCSLLLSPTFYQIPHRRPFLVSRSSKFSRRTSRRKNCQADMPVSIPVPRRDKDDEPILTSSNDLNEGDLLRADVENQAFTSVKVPVKRKNSTKGWFKCFGVDMSPDTIAVSMVYFVQGVLGLSRLAVSFYLKDDLHLDPAETAVITGFSAFPWLVKPLYGFISDSIPLFGYRRRSYLFLSGLLGAFSWTLMATMVDSKYSAACCILLGSLSVAFSDVVVDSMVVERARGESQSLSGSLQSLCWGSSAFGSIVSAYFSGSFVDAYGVRFVFGVTALLPLITSAVAVLVEEQRVAGPIWDYNQSAGGPKLLQSFNHSVVQLWDAVKQPNVYYPTLFVFLWQATPHSDSAMFYFTTIEDMLVTPATLPPQTSSQIKERNNIRMQTVNFLQLNPLHYSISQATAVV